CPTDGTVLEGGQAPRDENVGRSLDGKYRLDKRLSSGGMGTVYKATHLMLGKALAVKLIKADLPASPDVVRRFQREAKAASNLNHPNIVPAYDLGQTPDGTLYIAMEYIDGPSLKEVIQAGPIDPARTITLLRQVASALSLAHKHDIIHRDLKPQNIMLTKDADGRDVAKLLDFGIAKTLDDSATQLTATGFSLGTPQYMSPEQAYGRPVDGRSDLYSLGIILYEMLVGEVPFNDPSTPAVLVKQMTEAPTPPTLKRPDRQISPELAAIALRCLEKDPAKRFQTADEFSAALDAAAASLGATVLPLPGQVASTTPSPGTAATVVIGKPPSGQTTQLPTPVPVASPADQTTRAADAGAAAASGAVTAAVGKTVIPPKAAQPPAASFATPPTAPASSPAAPAPAVAPLPPATPKGGGGGRVAVAAAAAILLLGGAAYGAFRMGLIGAGAKDAPTGATSAANAPATPPAPQVASAATPDSSAAGGPPSSAATDPANGTGGGPPASPVTPPSSSHPPASGVASGSSPAGAAHGPSANRPASGSTAPRASAPTPGSASAPAPGPAPVQAPAAASAPAPPPAPANPSVAWRCEGPPDICNALKSATDQALAKDSMTSTRDAARADVALLATVTLVDEQTQQMFGTTFTVRNYTIDVNGEARASSDSVPMPSAATLNYDARYRDRLDEKARTVAADVVEHIRAYWKKRQP
ncbi:MAG TPA: serine/threonine-protein kinase, partial [Vicinamibacterales bacterium]